MKRIRMATVFLTVLLMIPVLTGCKKDKAAKLPTEYQVGEESVAAFTPTEEGATLAPDDEAVSYTYEGMAAPGGEVKGYMDQLTAAESGFSVVDDSYVKTEAPDFTQGEGEVLLAKNSETEGNLLTVRLSWSEGSCTVDVLAAEGAITEPETPKGMTYMEAIDYMKSLSPADLGLEGASMEEYNVYGLSGSAIVNEMPCMRMNVYRDDNQEETNMLAGMYLMTGDGKHIYLLDPESNQVTEVMT